MNRVSFRIDLPRIKSPNLVERNFSDTSICVEFREGLKYMFCFSENGLIYSPVDVKKKPSSEYVLGETTLTLPEVVAIAEDMRKTDFKEYHFRSKMCNHFSNELMMRLCNRNIPDNYLRSIYATPKIKPVGYMIGLVSR